MSQFTQDHQEWVAMQDELDYNQYFSDQIEAVYGKRIYAADIVAAQHNNKESKQNDTNEPGC